MVSDQLHFLLSEFLSPSSLPFYCVLISISVPQAFPLFQVLFGFILTDPFLSLMAIFYSEISLQNIDFRALHEKGKGVDPCPKVLTLFHQKLVQIFWLKSHIMFLVIFIIIINIISLLAPLLFFPRPLRPNPTFGFCLRDKFFVWYGLDTGY